MITKVKIEDFKCFEYEEIEFRPLTILTGTNSSGKSSMIQSILLSGNHANGSDMLDYIWSLGDFDDLKNKYKNPRSYTIEVHYDDGIADTIKAEKGVALSFPSDKLAYPSKLK